MIDGQEPEKTHIWRWERFGRDVSPERFLSKKSRFSEVKRQRKHLKNANASSSTVKKFTMIGLNGTK